MLLLSLLVHRFARVLAAVECFQGLSDTATIAMAPGVSVAPVVALENDLGLLLRDGVDSCHGNGSDSCHGMGRTLVTRWVGL